MGIVVGLDIGGSTTKVVGFADSKLLEYAFVKAGDPIAAAYGGVGKFLEINDLHTGDIAQIMMTGVGASHIRNTILDLPTKITGEFRAVGLGGLYVSGLDQAIVVSMGTGTSVVHCQGQEVDHIIGSGVGGGTLLGLANKMLNIRDFSLISDLADKGDLGQVDLTVADISKSQIPGLSGDTTASNFGKVSDNVSKEDLALGIVNLVFQSVGTTAVLAARNKQIKDIVLVGSVSLLPQGQKTMKNFSDLYQVSIHMPKNSEYATAIGAALSVKD